eukprot:CAMPEP_0119538162 /NCGR_PEP_ID=MMETSP1344-20130328/50667_1 /TAXON_ID=236787 /ORGANISM="Florenciella parvula, Strain CCMP2471" /LENGTH=160 /DNA_ID=CAMNT_0007580959 /DNA_START=204 /DNA_END=686 /DNA_ORIENTATION=-
MRSRFWWSFGGGDGDGLGLGLGLCLLHDRVIEVHAHRRARTIPHAIRIRRVHVIHPNDLRPCRREHGAFGLRLGVEGQATCIDERQLLQRWLSGREGAVPQDRVPLPRDALRHRLDRRGLIVAVPRVFVVERMPRRLRHDPLAEAGQRRDRHHPPGTALG